MKNKLVVAAALFAIYALVLPVAAQSIVGGPHRQTNIGGPTIHANPVVAPPRATASAPAPSPRKPVVAPISPTISAAPARPRTATPHK
jgi:hypothetical protein